LVVVLITEIELSEVGEDVETVAVLSSTRLFGPPPSPL
jgi:hypothetical protein